MINLNTILKLDDDINILFEGARECKLSKKKSILNLKGDNFSLYIKPILADLMYYNSVDNLYKLLLKSKERENSDCNISMNFFMDILTKLHSNGILTEINNKNEDLFYINSNVMKCNKITILCFLPLDNIKHLLNQILSIYNFDVELFYFTSGYEIGEGKNQYGSNVKVRYIKYSDIVNVVEEINNIDLLITLQSAYNSTLNEYINKLVHEKCLPWLNTVINDSYIEIGPLIVGKYTSCLQCLFDSDKSYTQYVNNSKSISFLTNRIVNKQNLIIGYSILGDEVLRYFIMGSNGMYPNTIDKIIRFDSNNLKIDERVLIKKPNCKICSKL